MQIKAFRCEADRPEDSVFDVDLSKTVRKMPATKL